MFEKAKLKKELKALKKQIEEVEKKRYRSQAQLVEAILKQETPNDDDVDYFNKYTDQIEQIRAQIQSVSSKLEEK